MSAKVQHNSHSIRLSVRFDVGIPDGAQSVDVCVPASSSFGEALPSIIDLANAPMLSVPWQAQSPAGMSIDPTIPLAEAGISHGDVIVCTPFEDTATPFRKDAAEALSDVPIEFDARGLAALATAVGAGCLGWLVAQSSLPTVPPSILYLLLFLAMLSAAVWLRHLAPNEQLARAVLAVCCVVVAMATVWVLVAGLTIPVPLPHRGWLMLAALAGGVGTAIALAWCADIGVRLLSAVLSSAALSSLAAVACFLVDRMSEAAAVILIGGFIIVLIAPRMATALAGLSVPTLPAAGQDLKVSDHTIDRPDERAARATALLDGICLGTGITAAVALIALGILADRPGFTTALCLAASGACALHAVRHRSAFAMWGLWLWTMSGLAAGTIVALTAGPWGVLIALLSGLAALSAPLWAHRVRSFSPTVFHWIEKVEALALAAVFPLAAHVSGLFDAIRGLG